MLLRLAAIARAISQALAATGLITLLAFAGATLCDGFLRAIANKPIEAVRDLGGLTVAVAISLCFPLACLQCSHITVKFAGTFIGTKASQALDAGAAVLIDIVVVLIARQLFIFASSAAHAGETSIMLEVPTAPFWFVVAGAMAIAAIVQAAVVALSVGNLFGYDWRPPGSHFGMSEGDVATDVPALKQ